MAISKFYPVRKLQRWWMALPTARQDRIMALVPLAAILLFIWAVWLSVLYLRIDENQYEQQVIERDNNYLIQRISTKINERQDSLQRLGRTLVTQTPNNTGFNDLVNRQLSSSADLRAILWLDQQGNVTGSQEFSHADDMFVPSHNLASLNDTEQSLIKLVQDTHKTNFGLISIKNESLLSMVMPIWVDDQINGFILARFNLSSLLIYSIPSDIFARYAIALVDQNANIVAGNQAEPGQSAQDTWKWQSNRKQHTVLSALPATNDVVKLRLIPYENHQYITQRGTWLLISALCLLTIWLLLANWRHSRTRQRSQKALLKETSFRRAIENSLLTGMRALDLDGRITYVNAAFCQMTGWSNDELIGQVPPYNFWHPADIERNNSILERMFKERLMQTDHPLRILRKDGSIFPARMYIAPLVTAEGEHTGWISSITDITEPTRVKEQLTNAYERFTRVLDSLDVAVSVAPLGSQELLFANHAYRTWYGEDKAAGHLRMLLRAGSPDEMVAPEEQVESFGGIPSTELPAASTNNCEIYVPALERWLEVRSRYLEWVDGRLVQMVIATDITARRMAEEQSAQHELAAQAASRLVTMGEMASSVAHELNQPLTAINNYCSGMTTRLKAGSLDKEAMLDALEKTSRQAQRAGQIIQRIRSFVKRSTPKYVEITPSNIISDVIELSEIDLRRRNVVLRSRIESHLPTLQADQILIEQVLVNLIKNAAESIDNSGVLPGNRIIKLRAYLGQEAQTQVVQFVVEDTGKGLSEESLKHLFEAFYTTKPQGLGIGLNLCRSIVESHQGRLQAQNIYHSGVISGCQFRFWLPVIRSLPKPSTTL